MSSISLDLPVLVPNFIPGQCRIYIFELLSLDLHIAVLDASYPVGGGGLTPPTLFVPKLSNQFKIHKSPSTPSILTLLNSDSCSSLFARSRERKHSTSQGSVSVPAFPVPRRLRRYRRSSVYWYHTSYFEAGLGRWYRPWRVVRRVWFSANVFLGVVSWS